jgi:iron(III) transport system ATP-binding protein
VSKVSCRALFKSFGATEVISGLDLEVPDGVVVTVLGESGSGKTTLLRMIAGFERPDAGTIAIDDELVDAPDRYVPPDRRRIGFVSQEGNLFPHLTVEGNVGFGLARAERRGGRVDEMLHLVGLSELARRYPHQLSGGQQQRVALARALAPRPRLVLLDEPFSSLDASLRSSLRADVMRILRSQRATTIFVTHDQAEALSSADLVGLIDGGRILQLATPETLYERPALPAVARFLGEANLVRGIATGGTVSTALGKLALTNGSASLSGAATVLVRPEQLSLNRLPTGLACSGSAPAGPEVAGSAAGPVASLGLAGRVVRREYFGHDCLVVVATSEESEPLTIRVAGRPPVEVGDHVSIAAHGEVVAWPAGRAEAAAAPEPR